VIHLKKLTNAKLGAFAILAILLAAFAYFYAPTASAQPGTDADPVVTRRFVEERISQLSEEIEQLRSLIAGGASITSPASTPTPGASVPNLGEHDELFALVMYYFETVYGERLEAAIRNIPGPLGQPYPSQVFEVVNPKEGSIITFEAGTEFILRSGNAVALTGPVNGIPNVTAGKDIMNGEKIELNHLMIVPVTDGRGVVFQTDAWIMVRGGHTVSVG
jgi:hypothetical protein